jgi:hypothetical protein
MELLPLNISREYLGRRFMVVEKVEACSVTAASKQIVLDKACLKFQSRHSVEKVMMKHCEFKCSRK